MYKNGRFYYTPKWKYRKKRLGLGHGLIKKTPPRTMRHFRGKNWYKYDSVAIALAERDNM